MMKTIEIIKTKILASELFLHWEKEFNEEFIIKLNFSWTLAVLTLIPLRLFVIFNFKIYILILLFLTFLHFKNNSYKKIKMPITEILQFTLGFEFYRDNIYGKLSYWELRDLPSSQSFWKGILFDFKNIFYSFNQKILKFMVYVRIFLHNNFFLYIIIYSFLIGSIIFMLEIPKILLFISFFLIISKLIFFNLDETYKRFKRRLALYNFNLIDPEIKIRLTEKNINCILYFIIRNLGKSETYFLEKNREMYEAYGFERYLFQLENKKILKEEEINREEESEIVINFDLKKKKYFFFGVLPFFLEKNNQNQTYEIVGIYNGINNLGQYHLKATRDLLIPVQYHVSKSTIIFDETGNSGIIKISSCTSIKENCETFIHKNPQPFSSTFNKFESVTHHLSSPLILPFKSIQQLTCMITDLNVSSNIIDHLKVSLHKMPQNENGINLEEVDVHVKIQGIRYVELLIEYFRITTKDYLLEDVPSINKNLFSHLVDTNKTKEHKNYFLESFYAENKKISNLSTDSNLVKYSKKTASFIKKEEPFLLESYRDSNLIEKPLKKVMHSSWEIIKKIHK